MRVLVVKTSSLGDVLHTLPALTDASRALPDLRIDWVVEEAFGEVPGWHPAVERTIPVANRRWRRRPYGLLTGEGLAFWHRLRRRHYDLVIDAQGLLKSAVIALVARGERCGLAADSAREPLAAWLYQRKIRVTDRGHAIDRLRNLFAAGLGYDRPQTPAEYGIRREQLETTMTPHDVSYVVFLHGTTWPSKHWPEQYWRDLVRLANDAGISVWLPWGSDQERGRAERLAAGSESAQVLPCLGLSELAAVLAGAAGAVAVDTGLGHLSAAVATPCVSIYGATNPGSTGTLGAQQRHITAQFPCSPCLSRSCNYRGPTSVQPACYQTVPPERVWSTLREFWNKSR